jgi:beta-lactamase regulating signal transducer with metallopeptidase domain
MENILIAIITSILGLIVGLIKLFVNQKVQDARQDERIKSLELRCEINEQKNEAFAHKIFEKLDILNKDVHTIVGKLSQ